MIKNKADKTYMELGELMHRSRGRLTGKCCCFICSHLRQRWHSHTRGRSSDARYQYATKVLTSLRLMRKRVCASAGMTVCTVPSCGRREEDPELQLVPHKMDPGTRERSRDTPESHRGEDGQEQEIT